MSIEHLEITQKVTIKNIFLFFFILFYSNFYSQIIPQNLFNDISKYKIGDDRSKLTEISSIIVNSLSDEKKVKTIEAELLNFIKSDLSYDAKFFASRELRIVGSEKSINDLKEFLQNEKMSSLARYALESIENEKVDILFCETIPKVSKENQIGIINSLGVRKNKFSIKILSELLNNNDEYIRVSAASALGKIANEDCLPILENHFSVSNMNLRNEIFHSYINILDKISIEKNVHSKYLKLYESDNIPNSIKQAALLGLLNSSSNLSEEILVRIKNEPNELKFIPISKIKYLPKETDFTNFAKLLTSLSAENQIQLLGVFEIIGCEKTKPFIKNLIDSENEHVRIAAIKSLRKIGNKDDVIFLANTATEKEGDEKYYAREILDVINGQNVDESIMENLKNNNEKLLPELIRSAGNRKILNAVNQILELTKSENKIVKSESFKTLEEIATINDINKIINILKLQKDNGDKRKAEFTISTILKKSDNKNVAADQIIIEFNESKNDNDKFSFLRLLGQTENDNAYNILVKELNNPNKEISLSAINGISLWKNSKPRDILLNVAQQSDGVIQSAALKGFTNFIEIDKDLMVDQKIEFYKKSLELSKTSNEKNIALDGIGRIDDFKSLDIFKTYINQSDLKETVEDGINRVGWHLHKSNPEKVKEYILYFIENVEDEKFKAKNSELVKVIDRFIKQRDSI
ncbi:MAG: HEAT repeat domain-containing protein [Ignavibacteriae bacterium]|nr:HEAT repeat domain-containing protein [Ignavibacteriota bacterium]